MANRNSKLADVYHTSTIQAPTSRCESYTCTPAPASSDLICVIGASDGILQFRQNGGLSWVGSPAQTSSNGSSSRNTRPSEHKQRVNDVFSLDFLRRNHNVILAGSRGRSVSLLDLRLPATAANTDRIVHRSSVAHVRSVSEHHVLASGPRHAMALYDIRFRRLRPFSSSSSSSSSSGGGSSSSSGGTGGGHRPLLTFPDFRNEAHLDYGLDVDTSIGAVAAAQDDGRVGVYSLRSGRRLACPPVDAVAARGVVRSVVFETLPRDRNPSLFLGIGQEIKKYSFGVLGEDDEGLEEW